MPFIKRNVLKVTAYHGKFENVQSVSYQISNIFCRIKNGLKDDCADYDNLNVSLNMIARSWE